MRMSCADRSRRRDAVIGRPMGVPKTAVFGLLDLVGIDLSCRMSAEEPDGDAAGVRRATRAAPGA
jgi:3-hydroxyacyl-CoA dehydrogenase